VVEITQKMNDQKVVARCGVGYADGNQTLYAEGVLKGTWVPRRGPQGFGFDFYFVPEGLSQTFSEMGPQQKNQISQRFLGWQAMRQLLLDKKLVV
jgi:inosine/xanthosine triphosphate pyrophosphatase family protein